MDESLQKEKKQDEVLIWFDMTFGMLFMMINMMSWKQDEDDMYVVSRISNWPCSCVMWPSMAGWSSGRGWSRGWWTGCQYCSSYCGPTFGEQGLWTGEIDLKTVNRINWAEEKVQKTNYLRWVALCLKIFFGHLSRNRRARNEYKN